MSERLVVAGIEVSPDHFIGGERVASESTFTDLSPIDEQPLGEVARGGKREADLAVAAATEAFPAWAALAPPARPPTPTRPPARSTPTSARPPPPRGAARRSCLAP